MLNKSTKQKTEIIFQNTSKDLVSLIWEVRNILLEFIDLEYGFPDKVHVLVETDKFRRWNLSNYSFSNHPGEKRLPTEPIQGREFSSIFSKKIHFIEKVTDLRTLSSKTTYFIVMPIEGYEYSLSNIKYLYRSYGKSKRGRYQEILLEGKYFPLPEDMNVLQPKNAFMLSFKEKDHHINFLQVVLKLPYRQGIDPKDFETYNIYPEKFDLSYLVYGFLQNRYFYFMQVLNKLSQKDKRQFIQEIFEALLVLDYQYFNPKKNIKDSLLIVKIVLEIYLGLNLGHFFSKALAEAQQELFPESTSDNDSKVRKLIENRFVNFKNIYGNFLSTITKINNEDEPDFFENEIWQFALDYLCVFTWTDNENLEFPPEIRFKDDFNLLLNNFLESKYPMVGNTRLLDWELQREWGVPVIKLLLLEIMEQKRINSPMGLLQSIRIVLDHQKLLQDGMRIDHIYTMLSKKYGLSTSSIKKKIRKIIGVEGLIIDNIWAFILNISTN